MDLKRITAPVLCAALLLTRASGITAAADEPKPYFFGDVNLDGEVTVTDIVFFQKYLLGLADFDSEASHYCADLNVDGDADVYDLGLLKRLLLADREKQDDGAFIEAPLRDFYGSMPSQGKSRMMVFYVDFPDCKYEYEPSADEITAACFGEDESATDPNYPFNSIRSFLRRSSKGALDVNGTVFRYTAKHPIAYYQVDDAGEPDDDKVRLMTELFQYHNRFVDFSYFDSDKDGIIDNILVNVPHTASDTDWWPGSGQNYSNLEADGVKIGHTTIGYDAIASADDHREFVSTYIHETGHTMGLPDYYLFRSEDIEGFHGDAGSEMMDTDNYSDFGCFSKLMLGWYREKQVQIYDTARGGDQTFELRDAQSPAGNCLILPCGKLDDNYNSEYIILEYITDTGSNSALERDKKDVYGFTLASGVRAFHVQAAAETYPDFRWLTYQNLDDDAFDEDGIRLIRLVNDREGGQVFHTGDFLNGDLSGFHWYAADGTESVDTGYTVRIGDLLGGVYSVTVSRNAG